MSSSPYAGVLIAGGPSSRMGQPKADIDLHGTTLGQRAFATLSAITPQVYQAGGNPIQHVVLEIIPDLRPNAGPAAGIEAALSRLGTPIVVLAVDLPFVPPELLQATLQAVQNGALISAPRTNNRWHPLCATYSPAILPKLTTRLDAGNLRLQELLTQHATALPATTLTNLDPAALTNLNTPQDLAAARRRHE